jgi:hypothetical protein
LPIGSYESPLKNKKNDTKIIYMGHIEAELWAYKVWGYPLTPKISTRPLARPLEAQERLNWAHQHNSIGTTCTPKIIQIGEVSVPLLGDLSWNAPVMGYRDKFFIFTFTFFSLHQNNVNKQKNQ